MVTVRVYTKVKRNWKYFVAVSNKTIIPPAVPSHIQRTLVE